MSKSYPATFKFLPIFLLISLLFIIYFLFGKVAGFDFVSLDDTPYVIENPSIQAIDLSHARDWFFKSYGKLYQPLPMLSYALDYHFHGLDPSAYHQTNLFLYALNAGLVFWLFLFFFKEAFSAWLGALIFAIHPVQIDTVAWVAERKNLLLGFFLLLGMNLFVRAEIQKKRLFYAGSTLTFCLAFFSKINAVVIPLLAALWDYFQNRKLNQTKIIFYSFFFLAALVLGVGTLLLYSDLSETYGRTPLFYLIADQCRTLPLYLSLIFFPHHLSLFYPIDQGWLATRIGTFFSFIFTSIFWTGLIWALSKKKSWAFWLGWFAICILPAASLLPLVVGHQQLYLPLIGIIGFLLTLAQQWKKSILTALSIAALILGFVTSNRLGVWENSGKLWSDVLLHRPKDFQALFQYANYQTEQNNYAEAEKFLLKSIDAAKTGDMRPYINLGNLYFHTQQSEKAAALIENLKKKNPDHPALPTLQTGLFFSKQKWDETIASGEKALRGGATDPSICDYLGLTYLGKGQFASALENFQRSYTFGNRSPQNTFQTGIALAGLQEWKKAIETWKPLTRQNPPFYGIYFQLGYANLKLGQRERARAYYQRSTQTHPRISEAFYHLGLMAIEENHLNEALSFFQSALAIKPNSTLYQAQLNAVQAKLKAAPEN